MSILNTQSLFAMVARISLLCFCAFLSLTSQSYGQSSAFDPSWITNGETFAKIAVLEDGMYRVTGTQLANQGVTLGDIDPATLKIFDKGAEIPLWLEGGTYWIPIDPDDDRSRPRVSIIDDDYVRLEQRIDRLKSGSVLAVEDTRGAMRRIVSNVVVTLEEGDELTVESNFMLGIARSAEQQFWMGRSFHELRREGDGFRIAAKKVLLINSRREIPLLQFLI